MKRASILVALVFLIIAGFTSLDAYGLAEAGLGVMAPGGGGAILGQIVVVPSAMLTLGLIGVWLDLWFSPGNDVFYAFPYLLVQLPLPLVKAYGGVAPRIWGSSEGLNLMPPFLEIKAKVGGSYTGFGFVRPYGEAAVTIAPLQGSFTGFSLVVGARFGI